MENQIPILEYHDISEKTDHERTLHSPYVILKNKFYDQMNWLSTEGFRTLTIDDAISGRIPKKAVVLTFDDGHISNYEFAFSILKEFNFSATFFIVPQLVGKRNYITRDQILEMYEHGMRFESHSLTHRYLIKLATADLILELRNSKKNIEEMIHSEVNHFSVPFGFYNGNLISFAKEIGYRTLVTEDFGYYRPDQNSFQILPRFTVKSNITLNKFKKILESKKIGLSADYLVAAVLKNFKRLLGFDSYVRFKCLVLRTRIPGKN